MKNNIISLFFIMSTLFCFGQEQGPHYLNIKSFNDLQQFFSYNNKEQIIVAGHRGGINKGFGENSIESMEEILRTMPAFFEIDPRLTKDSVIVLMHDATLDRTTTGTGKLSDYTWAELQNVRLKDFYGNSTPYKIPLLEDVFKFSKGKTVINLDKKDVPMEMIAALIKKYKASNYVMLTVHTGAQARYYYDRFPHIMMSAFMRNKKEFQDMLISGVPLNRFIAYVGPEINETNKFICDYLKSQGVRYMISLAPTHDKLATKDERIECYKREIASHPGIIESDRPQEIYEALTK